MTVIIEKKQTSMKSLKEKALKGPYKWGLNKIIKL